MIKKNKHQKCQVSGMRRCPTCGQKDYGWTCGRNSITRIKDVVCNHVSKTPFWVCQNHKKEFLKCGKGEQPHYKEVKSHNTTKGS